MAKKKGAGAYTEFLEFMRLPTPQVFDSVGGDISTPTLHFYSHGAFEPLGGREFPVEQKRWAESTARFRIPYQEVTIDPALHSVAMSFDEEASPPNVSTWNITGVYGDRFETTIEVREIR